MRKSASPHIHAIAIGLVLMSWATSTLRADIDPLFTDRVGLQIQQRIVAGTSQGGFVCGGEPICGVSLIPAFYEQRQFAPMWLDAKGVRPTGQALIHAITQAAGDGLTPGDYHLSTIQGLLADLEGPLTYPANGQEARWADLDLLLTDAFLLMSTHLAGGRVNPQTLHTDWLLSQHPLDVMAVLNTVVTGAQLDQVIDRLRPAHAGYARLRTALQQLRELDGQGGWPQVPPGATLRPEDRDARILTLRHRLTISGDLPSGEIPDAPDCFDEPLKAALTRFQRRHGLEPDGLAGRLTIATLNATVKERIRQVELNLERWRWLPDELGERYILVNPADFNLRVVENNEVVLQMRVVVGRPARRTPVFSAPMTYMVINPYWTVPLTIAVEDMLPRVIEDPGYFERQAIRVYYGWEEGGQSIDPRHVDWHAYGRNRFPFRLVQEPGPSNALGRIKFMFPNQFSVYLHDTPHRALFDQNKRDFSSGCIRVEDAAGLAAYLLRDTPDWTPERLKSVIASKRQQVVMINRPITVHLIYMTAWVDETNTLQFRSDIYGRDTALDRALRTRPHATPSQLELYLPPDGER